ncbi:MAG TPA: hypothetical protein VH079_18635 [Terriglobales bacterium]|nr:hypothetical protein [Terriglobales bacterium]
MVKLTEVVVNSTKDRTQGGNMNIDVIIQSLKDERGRIDAALKALGGMSHVAGDGTNDGAGKRKVSLKSRRKMAAAQKARWATRKAAGK